MASNYILATLFPSLILSSLFFTLASPRKLTPLVHEQPPTMKYHNDELDLKGNITVNLIWYGKFTQIQRSIIIDDLLSLNSRRAPLPSVASWWRISEKYHRGTSIVVIGEQILDENCSLGKSLKNSHIILLASKAGHVSSVNVILTAKDVAVDGFCTSRCETHSSTEGKTRFAYAWVGNFCQPFYGPQTQAPNGDVNSDEMIINLVASVEQKTEFNTKSVPKKDQTPPTKPRNRRFNREVNPKSVPTNDETPPTEPH